MDKQSEREDVAEDCRLEEAAASRRAGEEIADRIAKRERPRLRVVPSVSA